MVQIRAFTVYRSLTFEPFGSNESSQITRSLALNLRFAIQISHNHSLNLQKMPNPAKPTSEPDSPIVPPERPRTLKRRISSSFNTILAALPIRRSSPHISSSLRSCTELGEEAIIQRGVAGANQQAPQPPPVIRLQVPSLSETSQPCPYDASEYHSFPSVERRRCDFCGMRPPKSPSGEPCNECQSQSALSHMKSAFTWKPGRKIN